MDQLIQNTELELCILEVDKDVYRYLDQMKYQMGLIKEEQQERTVLMHFTTYGLEYFARWILSLGTEVKVVSPDSLFQKVKSLAQDLATKYS